MLRTDSNPASGLITWLDLAFVVTNLAVQLADAFLSPVGLDSYLVQIQTARPWGNTHER